MKTGVKYVVKELGGMISDHEYQDPIEKGEFRDELEAVELLATLDEDYHWIERYTYEHIADGIYDWEGDENYGDGGCGKYLYEFSKT